ncbi:MAG: MCE family protein [Deltaproteobacteria bacterium]|nr:MCE family protein [Deltaproteobacteria bacterium]
MPENEDKDPRFKGLELKVGIMALVAIAGIAVVIAFMGVKRDLFTKKYALGLRVESGSGFLEGMPVKLSGFKIGRVKKLELTETANVTVTLEINKKYQRWLREGAKARLSKEGMIGDSFVEVTVGDPKGKMLANGDEMPYEKTRGIEELISEAKPILQEVKDIIHSVNDPKGDIRRTMSNIREFTSGLKDTREKIDTVIEAVGATVGKVDGMAADVSAKSGQAIESMARTMKNAEDMSGRLVSIVGRFENVAAGAEKGAAGIEPAAVKLGKILDDVKLLTGALSAEGPRIRQVLGDAGDAAREGKTVLKGVKESWPVRLMVPIPKKPELVPLDGYFFEKGKGDGR